MNEAPQRRWFRAVLPTLFVLAALQSAEAADSSQFVVDGRVFGPDGQPFSGAKLYAIIDSAENRPAKLKDPKQPLLKRIERPGQVALIEYLHPKVIAILKQFGREPTFSEDDPFLVSYEFEVAFDRVFDEIYESHPALHPPLRGISDTDGRFRFGIPVSDLKDPFEKDVALVAVASGYGPAWSVSHEAGALSAVELRLVEDLPVRGRIVDHQGNPVVGARVTRGSLRASPEGTIGFWKDMVEAYVADLNPLNGPRIFHKLNQQALNYQFPGSRLLLFPSYFTTDADGRFTITGVGANRVLSGMRVTGPGIPGDVFSVATVKNPGIKLGAVATKWGRLRPEYRTYGAEFEHKLTAQQQIEGTIRDAATGRPLSNVYVSAFGPTHVYAFTNSDGKYRLASLSKAAEYRVSANPRNRRGNQPYVGQEKRVKGHDAPGPLNANFDLQRGVVLHGLLTAARTGVPLQNVRVWYATYPENKRLDAYFFLGNPRFPGEGHPVKAPFDVPVFRGDHAATAEDGTYDMVVLPGRAVFAFYAGDQYQPAEEFNDDPMWEKLRGTVPALQGFQFNDIKRIVVPEDAEQINGDFQIKLTLKN